MFVMVHGSARIQSSLWIAKHCQYWVIMMILKCAILLVPRQKNTKLVLVCTLLALYIFKLFLCLSIYFTEYTVYNLTAYFWIGVFYYTLGNLSPRYRSTLRTIQLIAIARTADIRNFGVEKLLASFVTSINMLARVCYAVLLKIQ